MLNGETMVVGGEGEQTAIAHCINISTLATEGMEQKLKGHGCKIRGHGDRTPIEKDAWVMRPTFPIGPNITVSRRANLLETG